MPKWLAQALNIISFGSLGYFAKRKVRKQNLNKNTQLNVNNESFAQFDDLIIALGNKQNIISTTNTISSITFKVKDIKLINLTSLKEISKKGVISGIDSITLLIGDTANKLANDVNALITNEPVNA